MINAVFATDSVGGFGNNGKLPWPKCRADMDYFKAVTHNSAIVMGSKTANSMPLPLPYRIPIIVSKTKHDTYPTIDYTKIDLMQSLESSIEAGIFNKINLIGGLNILTLDNLKQCDFLFYSRFKAKYEADTVMSKEILDWIDSLEKITVHNDSMLEIFKVAVNGKL